MIDLILIKSSIILNICLLKLWIFYRCDSFEYISLLTVLLEVSSIIYEDTYTCDERLNVLVSRERVNSFITRPNWSKKVHSVKYTTLHAILLYKHHSLTVLWDVAWQLSPSSGRTVPGPQALRPSLGPGRDKAGWKPRSQSRPELR
jgi:uncharacterized membrane protein